MFYIYFGFIVFSILKNINNISLLSRTGFWKLLRKSFQLDANTGERECFIHNIIMPSSTFYRKFMNCDSKQNTQLKQWINQCNYDCVIINFHYKNYQVKMNAYFSLVFLYWFSFPEASISDLLSFSILQCNVSYSTLDNATTNFNSLKKIQKNIRFKLIVMNRNTLNKHIRTNKQNKSWSNMKLKTKTDNDSFTGCYEKTMTRYDWMVCACYFF